MLPNLNSSYITYDLTEDEQAVGYLLNQNQRAVLQNLRMETIEQKLQLTAPDLTEPGQLSYWQQEAYLRGQLDIISHLLHADTAARTTPPIDESE